ncbi:MAG: hypothetical protein ACI8XC_003668, partial [Gammaproteobacteria bacterium]
GIVTSEHMEGLIYRKDNEFLFKLNQFMKTTYSKTSLVLISIHKNISPRFNLVSGVTFSLRLISVLFSGI